MYDAKVIEQAARNIAKQISGLHATSISAHAGVLAEECNRIVSTGAPVALTEVQATASATDEPHTTEPTTPSKLYKGKTIFRTIGE